MTALIAAVILVALVIPLLRKLGDVLPWFAALGTAVIAIFLAPMVPHSPVACLATAGGAHCTAADTNWVIGLVFVLPIWVAVAIKMMRGDYRRQKGNRSR